MRGYREGTRIPNFSQSRCIALMLRGLTAGGGESAGRDAASGRNRVV